MSASRVNQIYEEAKRLFDRNKYQEALVLLSQPGLPEHRKLLYGRARCLAKLGNIAEAIACCDALATRLQDSRGADLGAKLRIAHPGLIPDEPVIPDLAAPEVLAGRRPKRWGLLAGAGLAAVGLVVVAIFLLLGGRKAGQVAAGTPNAQNALTQAADKAAPPKSGEPHAADKAEGGKAQEPARKPSTGPRLRLRGPSAFEDEDKDLDDMGPPKSRPSPSGKLQLREPVDKAGSAARQPDQPEPKKPAAKSKRSSEDKPPKDKEKKPKASEAEPGPPAPIKKDDPPPQPGTPSAWLQDPLNPLVSPTEPRVLLADVLLQPGILPAPPQDPPPLEQIAQPTGPPLPQTPVSAVIELQPYRVQQQLANARGDTVTLTSVNPRIGAWYVLELNVGGKKVVRHLEIPSLEGNALKKPVLSLYRDGLALAFEDKTPRRYSLWANTDSGAGEAPAQPDPAAARELCPDPVLSGWLAPDYAFKAAFTPACDALVYIRAQKPGAATKLETATDLLRQTRIGDWFVEKAKPYLIPAPETGNDQSGGAAAPHAGGEVFPQDADVDEAQITLHTSPQGLNIKTDAADNKYFYGRWYKAVNHPHVFVSIMKPTLASKAILESYKDRVGAIGSADKKRREADALVYCIALDLRDFRFGFALGADHPKLDWSARVHGPHKTKGPDGFDSKSPLCTIGAVPPYYVPYVVGAFIGGFKREHAAFSSGPLSKACNGSHFGFMEQGAIFSSLVPGLATIVIKRDGTLDMISWPENGAALLPDLAFARQNCPPIVEGRDPAGLTVPGEFVNNWGAGSWSGNRDGDLVTLRAGAAIQEFNGSRFLIFCYFTGATPSGMARVFQAYRCRYGMLLDMNTPNYCYAALYKRDAEGTIDGVETLHKEMAGFTGEPGSFKFLEKNDTRDFFYILSAAS